MANVLAHLKIFTEVHVLISVPDLYTDPDPVGPGPFLQVPT
jgi:hypothetical protein